MFRSQKLRRRWLCIVTLITAVSSPVWGMPMVMFNANHIGGGLFLYGLVVDNTGGSEPLSGLSILQANTLFGLTDSSVIVAPTDWNFFAPFPPFVEDLNYFSLLPAADIPINGRLGGFLFLSTTNPSMVRFNGFAVEGIGALSAAQIDLGTAQFVSEPTTMALLGFGCLSLLLHWKRIRG